MPRSGSYEGKNQERRIRWILLFFFAAVGALVARLFFVQIVNHRAFAQLADKQQRSSSRVNPERGTIFFQDKAGRRIPAALNRTYKNLAISPQRVGDPEALTRYLEEHFGFDPDAAAKKLADREDPYEALIKKLDPERIEAIAEKPPAGVIFEDERRRVYPQGTLASHLVGFVSKETDEEIGRYGIERAYEEDLAGTAGFLSRVSSDESFWRAVGNRIVRPPARGSDVVLTLDLNIQKKAEEALERAVEKWQAASGLVLVLDPASGRVLALSALPTFNPNEFSKENDFSVFLNPAVESAYEPGSVIKPVTMAAGLQEGKVRPESAYDDAGQIAVKDRLIRNFDGRAYHVQTMTQVLEKSLNLGAVFVGRLVGREAFLGYLRNFGFGEKLGIDLPGELSGSVSALAKGGEVELATASFGQGIAATPLQVASAIGAIANKGTLMRPFVAERVIDASGNETKTEPAVVREVVSAKTAEELTTMLVSVVRNGFEGRAGVKGYFVAAKTGTAQIPLPKGRGYSDDVVHTFVGYAPAYRPRFLILLQLVKPKGNRFASNTLTSPFHDLAEYILNYFEVPPDEK